MTAIAPVSAEHISVRLQNARKHLKTTLTAVIPMDDDVAVRVAQYYLDHKLATLDVSMGASRVKHGVLLDERTVAMAIIVALQND